MHGGPRTDAWGSRVVYKLNEVIYVTILYLFKCKFPLLSDYSPHESFHMSVLGIAALNPTTISTLPPLLVSWQDDGVGYMLRPPFPLLL